VAGDQRSRFTGGHDFILAPAQGHGCVLLSGSTRGSLVSVCLDFSVNVVHVLLKPLYTAVQIVLFILLSANEATFRHRAPIWSMLPSSETPALTRALSY